MTDRRGRRPRQRGMAALLVRGQDADFILDDLHELKVRDMERGMPRWRAQLRYSRNLVGSAYSVWRAGARWPRFPGVSWLDVKLAGRMLVKHPALTLVGCFALAIGIPVALAPVQMLKAVNGKLPFDEAERILGLAYWDVRAGDSRRATVHDYELWRSELTSFEDIGAARTSLQNLVGEDGRAEVVRGSEVTASAFELLRVQPLLGRMLVAADEVKGAAPVVLIGYDLWQTHFGGARNVVGRTLQFGRIRHMVVGVMPAGFLFPVRDRFWVPLHARALDYDVGRGPTVWVFGRLRAGVSREQAQAELTTMVRRQATAHPATYGQLRADVLPYTHAVSGLRADPRRVFPLYAMTLLMLAVTCGNVGTLMLARVAARSSEIAVRNALGASRGRIVMQLFIETLLLAVLAAAIGLAIAEFVVVKRLMATFAAQMPFWFDVSVTPFTIAVAGGLAVFSAVIAGAFPAFKATGKNVYRSLQRAETGGSGLRFGAVATLLIVAEVGIAVGGLSGVGTVAGSAFREVAVLNGVAADEYLTAQLRLIVDVPPRAAVGSTNDVGMRFRAIQEELSRRLAAEPGVRAVTYANVLPGMDHPALVLEVEGADPAATPSGGHTVRQALVDLSFFSALQQPILLGRGFDSRDLKPRGRPVIVNRSFVEQVLHGNNPLGRRVRYVAAANTEPGPWHEIVGVVNDLGMNIVNAKRGAGVYHAIAPGELHPVLVVARVGGDPSAFVPRLRTIVTATEPAMLLEDAAPLDEAFSEMRWQARFSSLAFALIAVIAVVLSAAGLYALMSFTVSERTREIGIRAALGAHPGRIVRVVVTRALLQLVAGVALGAWLGIVVVQDIINQSNQATSWKLILIAVAAVMMVIGLLACVVPTMRALRIQPIQALREKA